MASKLVDRMFLVITAIGSMAIFVVIISSVRGNVSKEWANFIYMSICYLIMLIYIIFTFGAFKRLPKWRLIFFQVIFYVLSVGIAVMLFISDLLPMPQRLIDYTFPMIALTVLSLVALNYCVNKVKYFKGDKMRRSRLGGNRG
jgi:hypothetical protein